MSYERHAEDCLKMLAMRLPKLVSFFFRRRTAAAKKKEGEGMCLTGTSSTLQRAKGRCAIWGFLAQPVPGCRPRRRARRHRQWVSARGRAAART